MLLKVFENKNFLEFNKFFITDISPSMEVSENINNIITEKECKRLFLLNHHKTALDLNKYSWANIVVNEVDSGTSLFFRHIKHFISNNTLKESLASFADTVASYNLWSWTKINNVLAKKLNNIYYFYKDNQDNFVKDMTKHILQLKEKDFYLSNEYQNILK